MLKINLLPLEKRRAEKTPLPRFFLIVADAAITAILVIYIISILLKVSDAKDANKDKDNAIKGLAEDVAKYDRIDADIKTVEARAKEAQDVVYRQFRWAEITENIWAVISKNKVWIDKLEAIDLRTAQSELKKVRPDTKDIAIGAVKLVCHAIGPYPNFMTKFRMDLKTDPKLSKIFNVININPDYTVEEEKDFQEGSSVSFSIILIGITAAPPTSAGQPVR